MATAPPSARRVGPRSVNSFASSTADKSTAGPSRPPPAKPVTLAKRILFPTLPADADLPPLLLSPAAAPELNAELYDFIALALRAYVNTWWSKITRYDKEFLPEITRILTFVMRTLEARLVATDLSPLVLRDLPTLLNQHWTDYRNAQSKLHTSYAVGGAASLPQLFHQMQPHMAVTADGVVDPVYVRQAVDHILKTCLPPEDYEPETERYIVREIILKVLVGSVLPRVTQPWFIHKIILDQLGPENAAGKAAEVSAPSDSWLGVCWVNFVGQGTRRTYIYSRVSSSPYAASSCGCMQYANNIHISSACMPCPTAFIVYWTSSRLLTTSSVLLAFKLYCRWCNFLRSSSATPTGLSAPLFPVLRHLLPVGCPVCVWRVLSSAARVQAGSRYYQEGEPDRDAAYT